MTADAFPELTAAQVEIVSRFWQRETVRRLSPGRDDQPSCDGNVVRNAERGILLLHRGRVGDGMVHLRAARPERFRADRLGSDSRERLGRTPLPFETSEPGIFAVGDVCASSMKRVAAAVGKARAVFDPSTATLGNLTT